MKLTLTPLVCVELRFPVEERREFHEFTIKQQIFSIRGGASGGTFHIGYYSADDATKIERWVAQNWTKRGARRKERS